MGEGLSELEGNRKMGKIEPLWCKGVPKIVQIG